MIVHVAFGAQLLKSQTLQSHWALGEAAGVQQRQEAVPAAL